MSFEDLVSNYGYIAVFLGTIIEGEIILFAGGFMAHSGRLKLEWVMLAAFMGSVAGDQIYFYFGRMKGRSFVQKRRRMKEKVEKVEKMAARHMTLLILGIRFMSGLRTVTPFAVGLTRITAKRFLILNAIGAVLWSVLGSLVGYLLGMAAEAAHINVKRDEHLIILGMVCTGALVFIIAFLHRRFSRK